MTEDEDSNIIQKFNFSINYLGISIYVSISCHGYKAYWEYRVNVIIRVSVGVLYAVLARSRKQSKNYIFIHISLTLEMVLDIIFKDIFMAKMPEC